MVDDGRCMVVQGTGRYGEGTAWYLHGRQRVVDVAPLGVPDRVINARDASRIEIIPNCV